jgi:hypothetical protein
MATVSTPSRPIIDDLDLDQYIGQDPDQSPDAMLSELDKIYNPDKAPNGGMICYSSDLITITRLFQLLSNHFI